MDKQPAPFNASTFLKSAGLGKSVVEYAAGDVIFSQGGPCDSVSYIRSGAVRLSVLSEAGKPSTTAV
jgi:CRP/FNR family cyclic AMP-dependent transcriptional regulator